MKSQMAQHSRVNVMVLNEDGGLSCTLDMTGGWMSSGMHAQALEYHLGAFSSF